MLMFLLSGTAVFANGDKFDGTYDMDRRHGFGVYAWKDGRIYEGEFYHDQRQGCGYVILDLFFCCDLIFLVVLYYVSLYLSMCVFVKLYMHSPFQAVDSLWVGYFGWWHTSPLYSCSRFAIPESRILPLYMSCCCDYLCCG